MSHLDDLGADIFGRNQMTMAHQKRLMPGSFSRIKENGDLESLR